MKIIPAMSIKHSRVAVVEGNQYRFLRNSEGQYPDPINLVKEQNFHGEEVFILDIDGLERNAPDLGTVKSIASFKDVWLDAGIEDANSMMDAFVSDASKVVMGTICMRSLDELRHALEISDNVIFSIGYDGGVVSPDRKISGVGLDELLAGLKDVPDLKTGLFFDLGGIRDGRAPDMELIARMMPCFSEVFVSGHLVKKDIAKLEGIGVAGVIEDFRKMGELRDEGA